LLISGVAITAVAMGVGAALTRSSNPAPTVNSAAGPSSGYKEFEIAVRSIPEGAEIWQVGANKRLGVTDTYLKFKLDDANAKISLVFRKEGYIEEVREVSPYTMLVHLKEDPRKRERQERPTSGSRGGANNTAPSGGTGAAPNTNTPPANAGAAVAPPPPPTPVTPPTPNPTLPTTAGVTSPPATPPPAASPAPAARQNRRKTFKTNEIVNPFGGGPAD
jgi:hypothetical protein